MAAAPAQLPSSPSDHASPFRHRGGSAPPTWANVPHKGQLAVLVALRFVDFFHMAVLQTTMVYQLKSFDLELTDKALANQAGVLQASFTAAQIFTSMLWGWAADRAGRKPVMLAGLLGTGVGCVGVAFSHSHPQAVAWRLFSGAVNGTIGATRTAIAELIPRPWHPRVFLLLPIAFNAANMLGPMVAGSLAESVAGLAGTTGDHLGSGWIMRFPYAAPYLVSSLLLFSEAFLVHFLVEETLQSPGIHIGARVRRLIAHGLQFNKGHHPRRQEMAVVDEQSRGLLSAEQGASFELEPLGDARAEEEEPRTKPRLPFSRIWTMNVGCTLLAVSIFDFHMGAYETMWVLFLAAPRLPLATRGIKSVLKSSAGLAFTPEAIGLAIAITGLCGASLQLVLYPWANARFGTMRAFRASLGLFPLAYTLAPFLALLPSSSPPPGPATGPLVWAGVATITVLQVTAGIFAFPATILLVNNNTPHPSALGTVHGAAHTFGSLAQTVGPVLGGRWFGYWIDRGMLAVAWWLIAAVALFGCITSVTVRNGNGHEIVLPGDEEDETSEHQPGEPSVRE
ncbi:major facilitator superfamily domain-containing protein [Diaporthe sp. PMI_573]|nr:major facilitator superfamily domain-containing protein [Diaporthaceae sp. PMI_573]